MSQFKKKAIAGAPVAATLSFSLVATATTAEARGFGGFHGGFHGGWGHGGWGRGYGWGGWG
jgi:Spy/CpxP family protein refolding chaperone